MTRTQVLQETRRMRFKEACVFRRNPISDSGGKPITFGVGTGMVQGV